jgi:predicted metal-dependent phosphoesterase TrpH
MMRWLRADLHVHTLLSPCAAIEMTPRNIIRHAVAAGVDIVAITDHNAGDNVAAALRAAAETGITVLPGMEVQTREEVHLLTLFEKMRNFVQWCDFIKAHRSPLKNDERKFGAQFVVDEADELVRVEEAMLLASTDLSVQEAAERAAELGGLAIAAHVDRPAFSLLSQLGFIPPDVSLKAVEVSRRLDWQTAGQKIPAIGKLPVIMSSDAHTIDDFVSGPKTMFLVESPTLAEMQQALEASNGRRIHR